MGTRADFYVGRGAEAEWLGSIAWDGYPEGIPEDLKSKQSEAEFRERVAAFIASRNDGTKPEDGWPWPWEDSNTTDYAYALDDGVVMASPFGNTWFDASGDKPESEDLDNDTKQVFPDMTSRRKVTFGRRSGIMVIGPTGPIDDPNDP